MTRRCLGFLTLKLLTIAILGYCHFCRVSFGQSPNTTSGESSTEQAPASSGWIVRDPRTGRLYHQRLVAVTVPTVQWETRTVKQTVYEPKIVTKTQAQQRTVYVPQTQMVMQPRVSGWNPFRPPVVSYEFQPKTSWVAQAVTVNTPITTQEWVPKEESIQVPQPVHKLQTQQQLVQTEVPQPSAVGLPMSQVASTRPPLLKLPLLAKQRMLPWAPVGSGAVPAPQTYVASAPPTAAGPPPPILRPMVNPINGLRSATYSAPLRTATTTSNYSNRDAMESGMSPTVLR